MFKFFKKKDQFISYQQPVVILNSSLPGFANFIAHKESGRPLPWMRVVEEEEIPYGRVYYTYVGGGKCRKSMKHDPVPKGPVEENLAVDLRNRVNDHAFGVNHFGAEYTQIEMYSVCNAVQNELLGR